MPMPERRAYRLEVRDKSDDGRTLRALVVPYDTVSPDTAVGSEEFAAHAFRRSVNAIRASGRWPKLYRDHDLTRPVGTTKALDSEDDALYGTYRLADTEEGNRARLDYEEGLLDEMSVGFTALREKVRGSVRRVLEARYGEASLVPTGAYPDARVMSLRSADPRRYEVPPGPAARNDTIIINGVRWA